jgi:FKBP-type peptidyl-prolyl cis-trans isomerase FkpA
MVLSYNSMTKLFLLALAFTAFSGIHCLKSNTTSCNSVSPSAELSTMQSYAASHGVSATQHTSGLLYQITNQGSGATPNLGSLISVRYTGQLLDGTVFDSRTGTPLVLGLGGLIQGWQIGLQLIQKGGTIKMIIPSALAYGCQGSGPVPANAIVYFEVELVDVQ